MFLDRRVEKEMEQLWITLPALAPDYSGVCSAMFDLGGMSVIHDASGCTGNYTGYDEPRWFGSTSMVYCSGLREIDAVLGRDDKLIDNICKIAKYKNPTCFTLIGSPVPMVIGSDMKGIAKEVENLTGKPAFGFSTNGLGLYNKGVSDAMLAVVKRFDAGKKETIEKSINILGTTPLDFAANGNDLALKKKLEGAGYRVLTQMMMGAKIQDVEQVTAASLNLVVTESGYETARYLYRKYRIPYVVGNFVGKRDALFETLESARTSGENQVFGIEKREDGRKKLLYVGEQILGNSIREALYTLAPQIEVTVGTMTGLRKKLAHPQDLDIPGEESLLEILDSGIYAGVIGDPLLEDLLPVGMELYKIPHIAMSSKLFWNQSIHFIGEEMNGFLQKIKES